VSRRLLVLGPLAQVLIVVAVLLAALGFYHMGDRVYPSILIAGVVSRILSLLPVAKGRDGRVNPDGTIRKSDFVAVVRRKTPPPLPLTAPPEEQDPWNPPKK
jgi:hypothetical protein